jgi:EAL domain-containing protein (putative c-di-GMP-specific phosphodiesterase class I)
MPHSGYYCLLRVVFRTRSLQTLEAIMNARMNHLPERLLAPCTHHAGSTLSSTTDYDRQCVQIRRGIREGEFSLAYQPIVDVHAGKSVGAEALLRWRHPTRGWLTPGTFADALLNAEVAWSVTAFVIGQISRDLAVQSVTPHSCPFVSVNVYPSQLRHGRLRQLIEAEYLANGCPPEALMIELLESEPHLATKGLNAEILALRKLGLKVAIDDFGSGAWTLMDLAQIELDVVKLTRELLGNVSGTVIADGALRILDALGTQAVIEGIETPAQLAWATAYPRVWAQGYAFARPHPDLSAALGWTNAIVHRESGPKLRSERNFALFAGSPRMGTNGTVRLTGSRR